MFLDTNIIIDMMRGEENITSHVEGITEKEPLHISIIQLVEISDWCLKNGIDIKEVLSLIKKMVSILPLNEKICMEGSYIKYLQRKNGVDGFPLIDGIILASARSFGQTLLSRDRHFTGFKDVELV